tara:strand:+ start:512 stop:1147 length:636 start_codon:yes stop_codon:yes gene_type:complete
MSTTEGRIVPQSDLESLIATRRTSKPATFEGPEPDRSLIRNCIEVARKAPNHHRTEPAYFYLLNRRQIQELAELNAARVADSPSPKANLEKAERKLKEWGQTPGLLIVTCHTDPGSTLARSKPALFEEDYAAVCCMTQNLLLLLHNLGIATKWSTAPIWKHSDFARIIGLKHGEPSERVVALLFYGWSQDFPKTRQFRPLDEILIDGDDSR